jgi:hypothetical protein
MKTKRLKMPDSGADRKKSGKKYFFFRIKKKIDKSFGSCYIALKHGWPALFRPAGAVQKNRCLNYLADYKLKGRICSS